MATESKQYQCNKCKLTPWLTKPGQHCICGGGILQPIRPETLSDVFGETFGSIFKASKDGK
jgi:hypothetical protein